MGQTVVGWTEGCSTAVVQQLEMCARGQVTAGDWSTTTQWW